jgi:tRNA(Ile)-lysidine synthase
VRPLAQRLLAHIRSHELFNAGDRVGVAVSGGIDSVALLRLLLELRFELGIVLSVVHFNHKLRGAESDGDEEFVRNLAREHDLQFYVDGLDVAAHAHEMGISLETAARQLRYEFFGSLIRSSHIGIPTSRKDSETRATPHSELPPGAEAQIPDEPLDQSAESAAPLRGAAQEPKRGLGETPSRSAEAPLFHIDKVATGHTLDDQAETVLMRIIRGAGMRGLGAIYPRIEVEDDNGDHSGQIVRPLLETRRCELQGHLNDIDQSWREDSTNADHHFTRNRVRKLLVPLLEKEFNPKLAEGLAELAEIARAEEDYWENEVAGWMGTAVHWTEPESKNSGREGQNSQFWQDRPELGHPPKLVQIQAVGSPEQTGVSLPMNASVDRLWFLAEPVAVQRRLTKAIAQHAGFPLEYRHVAEIIRFAAESGPAGKELVLPSGWKLQRESGELVFVAPVFREQSLPEDYEYSLPIPGRVLVNELGSAFEARIIEHAGKGAGALDALLAAESIAEEITVRNWRAGDRFWPAHTKGPKKLKDLLTDLHIAHTERTGWPVIVSGDEIVWVRGLPVCAKHRAKAGQQAVSICEIPLSSDESG